MIISDNKEMPFGKYEGKKMSEVPDYYLRWLLTTLRKKGNISLIDYAKKRLGIK